MDNKRNATSRALVAPVAFSYRTRVLITIASLAGAIVLPQALHVVGRLLGLDSSLGEMLLPMYLPILLASFYLSLPFSLALAFSAPILSYMLQGMPSLEVLPYITIELMGLAFSATVLSKLHLACMAVHSIVDSIVKVVIALVISRLIKLMAVLLATYVIGVSSLGYAFVLYSTRRGLLGILLEIIVVPLVLSYVEHSHTRCA